MSQKGFDPRGEIIPISVAKGLDMASRFRKLELRGKTSGVAQYPEQVPGANSLSGTGKRKTK